MSATEPDFGKPGYLYDEAYLNFTAFNCGYNSAVYTLLKFGRSMSPGEAEQTFSKGLTRMVSFKDLSRLFENHQLCALPLHFGNSQSFLEALKPGICGVAQLVAGSASHFVVFSKPAVGQGIEMFNYPKATAPITESEIRTLLAKRATGNILLVSDRDLLAADFPDSGVHDIGVRLPGTFPPGWQKGVPIELPQESYVMDGGTDLWKAIIKVANPQKQAVAITEIKGSCSCFKEAAPKVMILAPGESKEVTATFFKSRFNLRDGTLLAFKLGDSSKTGIVRVLGRVGIAGDDFSVTNSHVPYSSLDLGFVNKARQIDQLFPFTVLVRKSLFLSNKYTVDYDPGLAGEIRIKSDVLDKDGDVFVPVRIEVKITGLEDGYFKKSVHFHLGNQEQVFSLTGFAS